MDPAIILANLALRGTMLPTLFGCTLWAKNITAVSLTGSMKIPGPVYPVWPYVLSLSKKFP